MKPAVLITGASSGIGLEFARLFAAKGFHLVLVARSAEKLAAIRDNLVRKHQIDVELIAQDLAEVNAAGKLVDDMAGRNLTIDILVNNAGFGELGRVVDLPVERQIDMIRLNVVTVTHLARLLLPAMLERRSGGIINVASTAAFQPGPNMAVYYATKAYVLSLAEALHEEVLGSGVVVTCLAPGPTRTDFGDQSGMTELKMFRNNTMDAAVVARAGFEAFHRRKALVIPGFKNRIMAFVTRFLPRFVVRKAVHRLQQAREK